MKEVWQVFMTIKQGLEIYGSEVARYMKWLKTMEKKYGQDFMNATDKWSAGDYNLLIPWNHKLQGMEMVLGLNKYEIDKIKNEVKVELSA